MGGEEVKAFCCAMIVIATVALAVVIADARGASGHTERVAGARIIENCAIRKHPDACRWRRHRLHTIAPHVDGFLRPVGACESGTDHDLRHGLRVTNPSSKYRGRYQFGVSDWHSAGGRGDPVNAGWLEQAYRAVRWLHINGRDSWPNC